MTEQESPAFRSIDTLPLRQVLQLINREDQKVPGAVARVIPQICAAVELIVPRLARGGRMVYFGAGTSGRLGVLDAAECEPTFGTRQVIAVLAGGQKSMFRPVEGGEDRRQAALRDLRRIKLSARDALVAITASGRTPYTLAGLAYARRLGAATVVIGANRDPGLPRRADVAIIPEVGPEVIAGSTRMKAGTAQKLALNMISTASMIRLGRVYSNWMVNMRLKNSKLRRRGERILEHAAGASPSQAARALRASGDELPLALLMLWKNVPRAHAVAALKRRSSIAAALREAEEEWKRGREMKDKGRRN